MKVHLIARILLDEFGEGRMETAKRERGSAFKPEVWQFRKIKDGSALIGMREDLDEGHPVSFLQISPKISIREVFVGMESNDFDEVLKLRCGHYRSLRSHSSYNSKPGKDMIFATFFGKSIDLSLSYQKYILSLLGKAHAVTERALELFNSPECEKNTYVDSKRGIISSLS